MEQYIQPISWNWISAVCISSLIILTASSSLFIPISKFVEPERLDRLPKWFRWILVLPGAFIAGYIGETIPRLLFSLVEVVINHKLTFRPGFDSLVWQGYAPLVFVAFGIQLAPSSRFTTFIIIGGIKIIVALANLVTVFNFTNGGGSWNALDPITNSPLWWNAMIYLLCLTLLFAFGFLLAKQSIAQRNVRSHTG